MASLLGRYVTDYDEPVYLVFRVFVGLLFVQHGAQKLFGLFGGVDGSGGTAELASMFGAAGVIEFGGGLLVALGILTRGVALVAAIEMAAAQFIAHLPNGLVPIQNGGELALLFLVAFLLIVIHGGRQYSLERLVTGTEVL
jgi:putative oxidoreductase